uniref:E3 ubiquitin/ISG15 ligase TRIM25-like n=1 Tax=Sphaeramia orbicularis TaxID=375764 RepID=A0A672YQI4_9TELE
MALNKDLFDCSICLQLFEDPVTIACGHSYCMRCINNFWDVNSKGQNTFSCPQCRQIFSPRPCLKRNTLLADLLEEHKRTPSPSDTCDGPEDVQCDVCTVNKQKASKFCLNCLASYCETHLKPHFEVPPLKKHKLVQASTRIKESICGHHDKLLEIYCRTDQQFICLVCAVEEHKNHETVAVAAEKCEMQRQLEMIKQEVTDRLLDSEKKMMELREAADSIKETAGEVCDEFERLCQENISLYVRSVEKKCSDITVKLKKTETAGLEWTKRHIEQLKQEVCELRTREEKLNQLLQTDDSIQFLQGFWALGDLPVFTDLHSRLDTLTEFITDQKCKLKNMYKKEKDEFLSPLGRHMLSSTPRNPNVVTLRTYLRSKFKNFKLEVDPNTVTTCLCLSDGNRSISWGGSDQAHPDHPDREKVHQLNDEGSEKAAPSVGQSEEVQ